MNAEEEIKAQQLKTLSPVVMATHMADLKQRLSLIPAPNMKDKDAPGDQEVTDISGGRQEGAEL